MREPDTRKTVNQIQTFAFLDMEGTGLPRDRPRIVELSVVAVSRVHLLQMGQQAAATLAGASSAVCGDGAKRRIIPKLPRVLHKYKRLYYPWKMIPPVVEGMTGLCNEDLEHLPGFTAASAQALSLFLDLPKPVALVAHNGARYDFPLLMAELRRVGCADNFVELLCVDSLAAIMDIDAMKEREDIAEMTELAAAFDAGDFEEAFSLSKHPRTGENDEKRGSSTSNTPFSPHESSSPTQTNNHYSLKKMLTEPLVTPNKNHVPKHTAIPSTPSKPLPLLSCSSKSPLPRTTGTPNCCFKGTRERRKVGGTPTSETNGKARSRWLTAYRQLRIYRRLFDTEYEGHRAEEDCLALLAICGHYGSRFVEWADTHATSFESVEPMWVRKQSVRAGKVEVHDDRFEA